MAKRKKERKIKKIKKTNKLCVCMSYNSHFVLCEHAECPIMISLIYKTPINNDRSIILPKFAYLLVSYHCMLNKRNRKAHAKE